MQRGNSTLELILFLPLALFFLFVVIDAGLSLTQRAAISDAFRSAISSVPLHVKQNQDFESVAAQLAKELDSNIGKVFASYSSGDYEVVTKLYNLEIDPQTGHKIKSFPTLVSEYRFGKIVNQKLLQNFSETDSYLEKIMAADPVVSNFAEPQGLINNTVNSANSGLRYANISWLLYSEVKAVPVGINSSFLSSALGGLYSVQLQKLEKLRDY